MAGSTAIDLTGKTFGRLTAISRAGSIKTNVAWLCRCECGSEGVFAGNRLRQGKTKSCGCYRDDVRAQQSATHGASGTRLSRIWSGIKTRCNNPKSIAWKHYGGRGIQVCLHWERSFVCFAEWAARSGYQEHLSIDRIDVNGSYTPENCRWATTSEQAKNQRRGRLEDGRRIADVAEQNGLRLGTVRVRIATGWEPLAACTTPLLRKRRASTNPRPSADAASR